MGTIAPWRPVRPGEPAPDFTLPGVNREGIISLADYRGQRPLLLVLLRGLYCGFCRRLLVQLGTTREALRTLGVETLAVVATNLERARFYVRFRPTPVLLASDPDCVTHRAYGVPSRLPGLSKRVTFLVGRDGKIARVWPEVDPVLNVSEVLAAAQALAQPS